MNRGDSEVGIADITTLLRNFMCVVLAQHRLFYSQDLNDTNSSVKLNLRSDSTIFESLGLPPQSIATQWMLIIKMYRLQCLKEINANYNGGSNMEVEMFMNYHFDYQKMDDEVELILIPARFRELIEKWQRSPATVRLTPQPSNYSCRVFLRDNSVMLSINDSKFQVARVNGGSVIERLLISLMHLPASETLNMIDFEPNRSNQSFIRIIDKYEYRWFKTMLPILSPSKIALENPRELSINELLAMLPEIGENYRQPIASYLGVDNTMAE